MGNRLGGAHKATIVARAQPDTGTAQVPDHPLAPGGGFLGFVDVIVATDAARYVAGPFIAACALLVIAGVGKARHAAPAQFAARAAGLPVPRGAIVAFGSVELAAGVVGAVFGGLTALAVAACYLLLTVVAVRLLQRAPSTPCACLGSLNAVVTPAHVGLDIAAAVFALVAATGGSPFSYLSGGVLAGAVFMVLVACCVKLAILTLDALPELSTAIKKGSP